MRNAAVSTMRLHRLGQCVAGQHPAAAGALSRRALSYGRLQPLQPVRSIGARRPSIANATLARGPFFCRSYTEQAARPPRRALRVLKWIWRATYLSVLGGLVFLGYEVYALRYPAEQAEPDPSKKTLVILGACSTMRVLEPT